MSREEKINTRVKMTTDIHVLHVADHLQSRK